MKYIFNLLLGVWFLLDNGASAVGSNGVSVSMKEGDSVIFHTGVKTNQQEVIKWYCNDTRIAQISGDLSGACTDVQCNKGAERFRDRLKLDHQTGSLTITDIRTEDSGVYELKVISNSSSDKIFYVFVSGVSAADRDEVKRESVMEGESVTLDSGVMKNTNDSMTWYFNEILMAEITGDQSQICTDDQCKERFRDRLKLDHQTGSLTITDTRTSDSGDYKLQIISNNSSFSINRVKRFSLTVTSALFWAWEPRGHKALCARCLRTQHRWILTVPVSGLSSGAIAGIVVVVLLVFAAAVTAGGIYYHRHGIYTPPAAQNEDDNL